MMTTPPRRRAPADGAAIRDQHLRCPGCYRVEKQDWMTDPYARHAWVRRCGFCGETLRGWRALRAWAYEYGLTVDTARPLEENVARWPEQWQRAFGGDPAVEHEGDEGGVV